MQTKNKLKPNVVIAGRKCVRTTFTFPAELRQFVLRESEKPFPGSTKPQGLSAWIVQLIRSAKAKLEIG